MNEVIAEEELMAAGFAQVPMRTADAQDHYARWEKHYPDRVLVALLGRPNDRKKVVFYMHIEAEYITANIELANVHPEMTVPEVEALAEALRRVVMGCGG